MILDMDRAKQDVKGLMKQVLTGIAIVASTTVTAAQDSSNVAARIGDTVITLEELDEAWQSSDLPRYLKVMQKLYDGRRNALDRLIDERLLKREALVRDMTRDELMSVAVFNQVPYVTDVEVRQVYATNKTRYGSRTFENVQDRIRATLERQRSEQALQDYLHDLRQTEGGLKVFFEPPRHVLETLSEDPIRGPASAPVEIVVFSDFECPYCKKVSETIAQLRDEFGGQIRSVYKDFPLPSHPNAFKAAEAGNCAHDQGQFWEMHDRMFSSQGALDVESLKEYAANVGLEITAFSRCLDEGWHKVAVNRDMTFGMRHGVSSTPTLFINGRMVIGAIAYRRFAEIIREQVGASAKKRQ